MKHLTVDGSGIHDAVMAQVSPGGGDGYTAERIIEHLSFRTGQHVEGIGPRLPVEGHAENQIFRIDFVFGFVDGLDLEIGDRRLLFELADWSPWRTFCRQGRLGRRWFFAATRQKQRPDPEHSAGFRDGCH